MTGPVTGADQQLASADEVVQVARAIATAVAPSDGLTDVQASLLRAITKAMTEVEVDYHDLDELGAADLASVLATHDHAYRQRIVQHMVLGELVLRPLPADVAERVTQYAEALGVDDDFVQVARKYARGALGLAWVDLRRSGFVDRWDDDHQVPLHTSTASEDPFDEAPPDPELEARWRAFGDLPLGTLGRSVIEMYRARSFRLPGSRGAASAYLAQHDFVHVLADYGTTLEGELEVFAFAGRADPDPKGFAWLATMIGLYETGYIHAQGFFEIDVRERHLRTPGMHARLPDALRRGKAVCEAYGCDLFAVDFHVVAAEPVEEVRAELHIPPKSD
ncbi:MAG TPA: hypothetical protein VIH82_07570, partial [Acidimicrobiia bacterium]